MSTAPIPAESPDRETISRLAGGIAHDFNNIAMGIFGYVHLLLEATPDGDPRRDDLLAIATLTQRAGSLTAQLLALAQDRELHPELVDLRTTVQDVESRIRPLLHRKLELNVRMDQLPLMVRVDRGQVEQVLTAVLLRARDACTGPGRLDVTADAVVLRTLPSSAVAGAAFHAGAFASVAVSDNGPALSRQQRARLFEPASQSHDEDGMPVGLGGVLGIIHHCGGFLAVDSRRDVGTTLTLYLPAARDVMADAREPVTGSRPAGNETLLVVEDEDAVRQVVVRSLRARGYVVLEARNGGEALNVLQNAALVQLVVTDLGMPVMGGHELILALQHGHPQLPVILMTGQADNQALRDEVSRGSVPLLQKPFRPDALVRMVRALLDKRTT
jgi:two-component system cell cycle sensor histidine kinase/response regulator CckA